MKREEKYQDTEWFHYYNANPYGRITGDCVFRAISTALKKDYKQVVMEMTELGLSKGYPANDKWTVEHYLQNNGWRKCNEPRKYNNTKMTVSEFIADEMLYTKRYICKVGSHHIVAIVGCKVNDIWDSSKQTMHCYWVKE